MQIFISEFFAWFTTEYQEWVRPQPGEEDFLAFGDLLGYQPAIVLNWLHGDLALQSAEILSISGLFGTKVYALLGQPEPDPELLKIYNSFSHLTGEYRSKLAHALWESQMELCNIRVTANSEEVKPILAKAFKKWGFEDSGNK